MMRSVFHLVHFLALAFLLAPLVHAEVPPLPAAELLEDASVVVTGKVLHIQAADKKMDAGFVNSEYTLELSITKVLKGDGVSAGQKLVAKTWKSKERPRGWTGPGGQYTIPKEGANVKIYLTGAKGNFTALLPNGIETLK